MSPHTMQHIAHADLVELSTQKNASHHTMDVNYKADTPSDVAKLSSKEPFSG